MSLMQTVVIWVVPVLLGITVHEVAHGYVAYRLGDPTAAEAGRLTLNPIPHIDLLGSIALPLAMVTTLGMVFGWARPVPVNPDRLRQPRRHMVWVALAGPASNALMLLAWAGVALWGLAFGGEVGAWMLAMGQVGIVINSLLMLFNLLPVPPLDGAVVLRNLLPAHWKWLDIGPVGMLLALGLLLFGLWQGFLRGPLIGFIEGVNHFFGLPSVFR